jgi:hypothetical protein
MESNNLELSSIRTYILHDLFILHQCKQLNSFIYYINSNGWSACVLLLYCILFTNFTKYFWCRYWTADAVQCSRSGSTKLVQALVAASGIRPHWLLFVVRAHDGVVVGTVHGVQIRVGVAMRHWSVTKTGESNCICWILAYHYHFRRAGANGCLVRRVPCDDGPYRCFTY